MERLTLREAADRTARSITTLRRYIRSGRLRAEKRMGRFGPEYFVSDEDLNEAGLEAAPAGRTASLAPRTQPGATLPAAASAASRGHSDGVPLQLFEQLQMKHEQLLVQYGMVRAGGLRVLELRAEVEVQEKRHREARDEVARVVREKKSDMERLEADLREARLELEGRALEISALQEKVRTLELLTRNAVTTETIEKQFSEVMEQSRKVEEMTRPARPEADTDGAGQRPNLARRGPRDH